MVALSQTADRGVVRRERMKDGEFAKPPEKGGSQYRVSPILAGNEKEYLYSKSPSASMVSILQEKCDISM